MKNIGFFQCIHTIENVFINKNPNLMKKLIFILCMLVSLALTSCSDMYAQSVTLTNNKAEKDAESLVPHMNQP